MRKGDFFIDYTEEDLRYELDMLICSKLGLSKYSDPFLRNLCLEGWLLHARRIIEVFRLGVVDKKWKKRWGLISEHLSHANPSNRKNPRAEKRENPKWDIETYHYELIGDLEKVAEKYKSEYVHYDSLIKILKTARGVREENDARSSFNSNQL